MRNEMTDEQILKIVSTTCEFKEPWGIGSRRQDFLAAVRAVLMFSKGEPALQLLQEVAALKRYKLADARRTTTEVFVKAGTHQVVNVPDELLERIDEFLSSLATENQSD